MYVGYTPSMDFDVTGFLKDLYGATHSLEEAVAPYVQQLQQERQSPLSYVQPDSYLDRWWKERRDVLRFMPWTTVEKFPRQGNEGLYGFTFRDGKVNWREDLHSERKLETDVHESGHTPDEQETRYRVEEKMRALFPTKKNYDFGPKEYRV